MKGVVAAFHEHEGLGEVRAGDAVYGFHCTQLAYGSRRIAVGTPVRFGLLAGRGGRWEAGEVEPIAGDAPGEWAGSPSPTGPGPQAS